MPYSILIVEDDSPIREALKEKLSHENFKLFDAPDGQVGLDMALKEHPDLILLDLLMPIMDGMAFLKSLRNDAWGKKAKVIVLTNFEGEEKIAETMKLGVGSYLIKSDWKLDDLLEKIRLELSR